MTRLIQDRGFRYWEVFANPGPSGFPNPGRIVFHCQSDPSLRARALEVEGNKALAEQKVRDATDEELRDLLVQALEIR
jgi:hypothetical protein